MAGPRGTGGSGFLSARGAEEQDVLHWIEVSKQTGPQTARMILDTDVLIWAARGNSAAARVIDAAIHRSLSIVSLMELFQGARSKLETRGIRQSLLTLQFLILALSESLGAHAAALIEQHALAHGIQVADALIAATAMEMGEPRCTANVKHFRPLRRLSLVAFRPIARD